MINNESNKQKKAVTGEWYLALTHQKRLPSCSLVDCLACLVFVIDDVLIYETRDTSKLWGCVRVLRPYRVHCYKVNDGSNSYCNVWLGGCSWWLCPVIGEYIISFDGQHFPWMINLSTRGIDTNYGPLGVKGWCSILCKDSVCRDGGSWDEVDFIRHRRFSRWCWVYSTQRVCRNMSYPIKCLVRKTAHSKHVWKCRGHWCLFSTWYWW